MNTFILQPMINSHTTLIRAHSCRMFPKVGPWALSVLSHLPQEFVLFLFCFFGEANAFPALSAGGDSLPVLRKCCFLSYSYGNVTSPDATLISRKKSPNECFHLNPTPTGGSQGLSLVCSLRLTGYMVSAGPSGRWRKALIS